MIDIIGIFFCIFIISVIFIMITQSCYRRNQHTNQPLPGPESWIGPPAVDVAVDDPNYNRLDEATLLSYPKVPYSDAKVRYKDTSATCCSICLFDYKDEDMLRLLPECEHLFHIGCVDPWLLLHPTCPVCRTAPFPSPMPALQAEGASL